MLGRSCGRLHDVRSRRVDYCDALLRYRRFDVFQATPHDCARERGQILSWKDAEPIRGHCCSGNGHTLEPRDRIVAFCRRNIRLTSKIEYAEIISMVQ